MENIDISKASAEKNLQLSASSFFEKAREQIDFLESEFEKYFVLYKKNRRERAAFIEDVISTNKKNGIKTSKPLGQYQNEELIDELCKVVSKIPDSPENLPIQEAIQISTLKIDNRYNLLKDNYQKCQDILEYLAENFKLREPDTKNEVVFENLDDLNKAINEDTEEKVLELEEEPISEEDSILDKGVKEEITDDSVNDESDEEDMHFEAVFNNDNIEGKSDIINILDYIAEDSSSLDEEDSLDSDSLDNIIPFTIKDESEKEEKDYTKITLNGVASFAEMVNNGYPNGNYLDEVYNYGSNKEIIDDIAEAYNLDPIDVMNDKDLLKDIELEFPLDPSKYSDEYSNKKKVA